MENKLQNIEDVIEASFQKRKTYAWVDVCDVSEQTIGFVKTHYNIDLSNFKFVVETNGIIHSWRYHGIGSQDSKPISKSDFLLIPEIIKKYDTITLGGIDKRHKLQIIIFSKRIVDEEISIEFAFASEVRVRRKKLALQSFYKKTKYRKKKKPTKK